LRDELPTSYRLRPGTGLPRPTDADADPADLPDPPNVADRGTSVEGGRARPAARDEVANT